MRGVSFLILVMKKTNVMLGILIVVLIASIIAVNIGFEKAGENTVSASEYIETLSTKGKVVVIDAGHGGEDPGAVSAYSGAKEKDITLFIAEKTKKLLEDGGYTVIMTRTEDVLNYDDENASMTAKRRQDLIKRKKIMDESNADIVISIHLNSFSDSQYHGAQTFYTKESLSSKKLAISLQTALREILEPENEREALLKKDEIIITKNCKVTTAIVECGFLSNQDEEKKLTEEAYQGKIAESIKAGVDNYFTVIAPKE